jgi:hypothetical protein
MGIGIKSLHRKARLSKTSLVMPRTSFPHNPPPTPPLRRRRRNRAALIDGPDDMRRMRDEFGAIQQNVVRGAKEGEGPYALPVVGPMRHAVDTVGTGLGGLWSTVGHAAGGAADAVTYGLGSGLAALAGNEGGLLTDAVNTIGAGADAIKGGTGYVLGLPAVQQGLQAVGDTWQSIPPDARRTLGATGEIVGTFAPIPGVGKSAAQIAGKPIARAGQAIEQSGLRGAARMREARAVEALRQPPTPTNVAREARTGGGETGVFKQRTYTPDAYTAQQAKDLVEVMGDRMKPGMSNQGFIDAAKPTLDKVEAALQSAVKSARPVNPEDVARNLAERGREILKDIPAELFEFGYGEQLKKYMSEAWATTMAFTNNARGDAAALLKARRALDDWLEARKSTFFSQLEGGVGQDKARNYLDRFNSAARQAINHGVDVATDGAARKALDHESALITAIGRSAKKVSREAPNALGRFAEWLPDSFRPHGIRDFATRVARSPVNYTMATGPAIAAAASGASVPAAVLTGLGTLGAYQGAKQLTKPGIRRGLGALLQGRGPRPLGGVPDYGAGQRGSLADILLEQQK